MADELAVRHLLTAVYCNENESTIHDNRIFCGSQTNMEEKGASKNLLVGRVASRRTRLVE